MLVQSLTVSPSSCGLKLSSQACRSATRSGRDPRTRWPIQAAESMTTWPPAVIHTDDSPIGVLLTSRLLVQGVTRVGRRRGQVKVGVAGQVGGLGEREVD